MDTMTRLDANVTKAREVLAAAEVAVLRAAFPFQRTQALIDLTNAKRAFAKVEAIRNRAETFAEEDITAFFDNRPADF